MEISEKIIKIERQTGTLQVALYLQKHGESNFSTIYDNVTPTNQTVKKALKVLTGLELATLRTVAGAPTTYYKLTEKGMDFTRKLNEIEKILGE